MVGTGGEVLVSSGISSEGSSGWTSIESSPSGPHGVSGGVLMHQGTPRLERLAYYTSDRLVQDCWITLIAKK